MTEVLTIPPNVERIAIPADFLSYFPSVKEDGSVVLVIKKRRPRSPEFRCGIRHYFWLEVGMLPRGGIKLGNVLKDFRVEDKSVLGELWVMRRELPTARISVSALAKDKDDAIKRIRDGLGYVCAKGYLCFERLSGEEFRVSRATDVNAFVYLISHSVHSRQHSAVLKVEPIKGVINMVSGRTSTAHDSITATLLLCEPTATVKITTNAGPYRGPDEYYVNTYELRWTGKGVEKRVISDYEPVEGELI